VEPIEHNEVMPWCLTGPAVLPHVGKRVEEVSLKSMLMNCTHLLVAGTMASCTPIQSYDQVLLTFHKLENTSSQACWEHRDFGTHNPGTSIFEFLKPYFHNGNSTITDPITEMEVAHSFDLQLFLPSINLFFNCSQSVFAAIFDEPFHGQFFSWNG
jgi:hypothetical protein